MNYFMDFVSINEKDCIYIEPASGELTIPQNFDRFKNDLQLTGSFYLDQGIPLTYEMQTPEKPKKARIFRYPGFEILEK